MGVTRITISLPESIMNQVVTMAVKESRSKSGMIRVLIKEGIEVIQKQRAAATEETSEKLRNRNEDPL
ncbi:hypothetical protein HOB36_02445 [Candidatus Bathyarchaeota archaeon]|nr:hypothetical protein [Candidatus Bathyarchaeota archaeon]